MTIKCEQCKQQPECPLWCVACDQICCTSCYLAHSQHENKIQFICQECEQAPDQMKTLFCENCEQHLCSDCSEKIHNKGKRAKHILHHTSFETMKIKRIYIACEDVLGYYGYINYGALLMDLADFVPSGETFLLMLQKQKQFTDFKVKVPAIVKGFNFDKEFGQEFCLNSKALYPCLQQIIFIQSHRSCKLYDSVKETKQIKTTLHRLGEVVQKPVHNNIANISMSSISLQNSSMNNKSNISAKYPRETRNHLSINISTSTENSLRKRKRKSPILYFHPFTCMKGDKRSGIENYYRDMAAKGTLMVRKQNCKYFEDGVMRAFFRNIGQTEVEYVSLLLDTISIECLYWVVRSIQEDLMAPTQKLILSRLKQSFDIKVHSKLWNYIMKYLSSSEYENDRLEVDPMGNIPRLLVKPFNSQDSYILYCKSDSFTPVQWNYEDLGKLNQNDEQWRQFIQLIDQYFENNSQIGGGRYGCVQYIKFNAKKPLKECSLGKLSMFVQQAINKGIIRYHKTLLVSNRENDESQHSEARTDNKQPLAQLQKTVKIQTLQLLLIDNFREYGEGTPISLAQIPQNLRKSATFEINYIELGFPKLKNFLVTLSNILTIQLSKSHIVYHIKPQTEDLIKQKRDKLAIDTTQLIEQIIKELVDIIDASKLAGMAMEELYHQFSIKAGMVLDFMLFNTPDFYQFLAYYGQNYFEIQVHMGYFLVYKKWSKAIVKQTPETSTPTFKQTEAQYKFKNLQNFQWGETNNIWLEEGTKGYGFLEKQQQQENESQSFSDYKSIYNLIDDDSESKSFPKTVIVKQDKSKYGNMGLLIEEKRDNTEQDVYSNRKDDNINELEDVKLKTSKGQHNRMYSNNIQQRTQHYRVYSNMSRD